MAYLRDRPKVPVRQSRLNAALHDQSSILGPSHVLPLVFCTKELILEWH